MLFFTHIVEMILLHLVSQMDKSLSKPAELTGSGSDNTIFIGKIIDTAVFKQDTYFQQHFTNLPDEPHYLDKGENLDKNQYNQSNYKKFDQAQTSRVKIREVFARELVIFSTGTLKMARCGQCIFQQHGDSHRPDPAGYRRNL